MCDYAEEKRSLGSAVTSCGFERCRSSDIFRSRRLVRKRTLPKYIKTANVSEVWQTAWHTREWPILLTVLQTRFLQNIRHCEFANI